MRRKQVDEPARDSGRFGAGGTSGFRVGRREKTWALQPNEKK